MSHIDTLSRGLPKRSKDEGAWDRHKAWIARRIGKYGNGLPPLPSKNELDVLIEHHRFIREEAADSNASWEERLALRWYDKLFREYALVDLKHYKSGDLALRWRTSDEVVARVGELTCGSLRCKHHAPQSLPPSPPERSSYRSHRDEGEREADEAPLVKARLKTWQLPFVYEEAGQTKEALVKVVLCDRCGKKIAYKDGDRPETDGEQLRRSASPKARQHGARERDRP